LKEGDDFDDSQSLTEGFVSAEEEWDEDSTLKGSTSGTLLDWLFGLSLSL
jgi:hypothetical protein